MVKEKRTENDKILAQERVEISDYDPKVSFADGSWNLKFAKADFLSSVSISGL